MSGVKYDSLYLTFISLFNEEEMFKHRSVYLLHMEPASAFVLASSPPNDTVADLASKLMVADSLLKLFLLCAEGLVEMSA